MRMLMGANGIYADGKAQPLPSNGIRSLIFLFCFFLIVNIFVETTNEQPTKRAASPDKTQSLEYLIRGELVRACPNLPKNDGRRNAFLSFRMIICMPMI